MDAFAFRDNVRKLVDRDRYRQIREPNRWGHNWVLDGCLMAASPEKIARRLWDNAENCAQLDYTRRELKRLKLQLHGESYYFACHVYSSFDELCRLGPPT